MYSNNLNMHIQNKNTCFFLFIGTPMAYGSSQGRGQIGAVAASLHHSHSKARSLTHWSRPGIEPMSSWILVVFVTTEPLQELLKLFLNYAYHFYPSLKGMRAFHTAVTCSFKAVHFLLLTGNIFILFLKQSFYSYSDRFQ